jgi:hypothetical protein
VRCICLLHIIIIDLEGITHDHSVLQETSQIRGSRQARTNVCGRSYSRSSKEATDVKNAFKAYFNGPTAAILSQNQWFICGELSLYHIMEYLSCIKYNEEIFVITVTIITQNVAILKIMYVYKQVPYFLIDNAHLILFRHSF